MHFFISQHWGGVDSGNPSSWKTFIVRYQSHCCWWPGDARSEDISSHGISVQVLSCVPGAPYSLFANHGRLKDQNITVCSKRQIQHSYGNTQFPSNIHTREFPVPFTKWKTKMDSSSHNYVLLFSCLFCYTCWPDCACICMADSRFAPSQWETALLCNDVSHWLGASPESALYISRKPHYEPNHWPHNTLWLTSTNDS